MTHLAYKRVHHNLETLKLATMKEILDNSLEFAVKEESSTLEVLDYLLEQEVKSRQNHAFSIRMRMACFPMEKRLEDFDISFQPSLDPMIIKDLTSLRFIHQAEKVVFRAPLGFGKPLLSLVQLGCDPERDAAKSLHAGYNHGAGLVVANLVRADDLNGVVCRSLAGRPQTFGNPSRLS